MKKKTGFISCLLLAALIICGCGSSKRSKILYYYKAANISISESSILKTETVTVEDASDISAVAQQYLKGPAGTECVSPFPKGLALDRYEVRDNVLQLYFNSAFSQLTGVDRSIALSCICMTFTQVPEIDTLDIYALNEDGSLADILLVNADNIVFNSANLAVIRNKAELYYPDHDNRYLIPEYVTIPDSCTNEKEVAFFLLTSLAGNPQNSNSKKALTQKNIVKNLTIENGVCYLECTDSFYANYPETEEAQRVTILSMVNTLTSLDEIQSVRFSTQNFGSATYGSMDLMISYTFDDQIVGPVRAGLNELDADLYVLRNLDKKIIPIPIRIRPEVNETHEEVILRKLLSFLECNGLSFPQVKNPEQVTLSMEEDTCIVSVPKEWIESTALDYYLFTECLEKSLKSLSYINEVKINLY